MAQQENKRQPTAEVYQEVRSFSADRIYKRTFTPINNSNYQTLKKNTTNSSNYAKYQKAIGNSNYDNKR